MKTTCRADRHALAGACDRQLHRIGAAASVSLDEHLQELERATTTSADCAGR